MGNNKPIKKLNIDNAICNDMNIFDKINEIIDFLNTKAIVEKDNGKWGTLPNKGNETYKCRKCGDEYQILPADKKPNPRICYQCREESEN